MNDIITSKPLAGRSFVLNSDNVSNFSQIISEYPKDMTCEVTAEYDGLTISGMSTEMTGEIIVTFSEEVAIPSGSCLSVECTPGEDDNDRDCKNVEMSYSKDLKLAVLDEKGCLKGWIKVSDIFRPSDDGVPTLCKLLGLDSIPEGHIVASDRILTVSTDCSVKSISATDLTCKDE